MEIISIYAAYDSLGYKIGTFNIKDSGVDTLDNDSLLKRANEIFDESVYKVEYLRCIYCPLA